jgi:hypothetical protein
MLDNKGQRARATKRFGAAELFGQAVVSLIPEEFRRLARAANREMECPFHPDRTPCNKKGGVCSLTLLERNEAGSVRAMGMPVTTCPRRFLEGNTVFQWVGETLLGASEPRVVSEIPFLMSENLEGANDEVGRIDNVLVAIQAHGMSWCALEMQAVYFSGAKMEDDFIVMREWTGPGMPFPAKHRRPDYRSSGPKRLMPQLQIKVPTLRRWGRKMAVVVDKGFWESLGEMRRVGQISNADLVWFIVGYEGPRAGQYRLKRCEAVFTTLENAVEGLTGGSPVSLEQFERVILQKLERSGAT